MKQNPATAKYNCVVAGVFNINVVGKFQGKYRIKSTRLENWDYGNDAAYFVTICTQNREHYFGEIDNGIMQLSEIGKMTNKYWLEISNHFPFVQMDEFVIMPDHVHGIIIINKPVQMQYFASQQYIFIYERP